MTTTRMDTRVETLEKGMEEVRSTVHTLSSDVHTLNTTVHTLSTDMHDVRSGLEDLRSMLGALMTRLDGPSRPASHTAVHVADPTPINAAPPTIPADPHNVLPPATHAVPTTAAPSVAAPPAQLSTLRRLDLPIFNGDDPVGWVARMEQYLDIMGTPETAKVASAMVAMDGRVLHWVRYFYAKNPAIPWHDFAAAILQRYGGKPRLTSYEAWVTTRQEGSVDDYIDVFLARSNQMEGLSDQLLLGSFLGGLHPDIRQKIRSRDATHLDEAMQLAREIEDDLSIFPQGRTTWRPPWATIRTQFPGASLGDKASFDPDGVDTHQKSGKEDEESRSIPRVRGEEASAV